MNSEYKKKVIKWNNQFPVDYWWRKKHNIAFMSEQHCSSDFWSQLFEYYEDILINELFEEIEYELNQNKYLKIREEIDLEDVKANEENALKELEKFKKT